MKQHSVGARVKVDITGRGNSYSFGKVIAYNETAGTYKVKLVGTRIEQDIPEDYVEGA